MYKTIILLLLLLANGCGVQAQAQYAPIFEGKRILITGGTGFIGRALLDEIVKYNPREIVVFSRDEVKHFRLLEEYKNAPIRSVVGDIRDYDAIYRATKGMDLVIHAAALKRIDLLEYHIGESIQTNVIGSSNIVRACLENEVKQALLVSTDKACAPINAYGACKFLAEKMFTNFAVQQGNKTVFSAVRYGNVLQSTGSVIPFFCEKIRNGQKIPLTDERMTRFFITKQQAVELIFDALLYSKGGEVFVPILPAFKIVDLIAVLQEKLGASTDIEVVGLRPGEKMHEAMINSTEMPRVYRFENMYIITPSIGEVDPQAAYVNKLALVEDMEEYASNYALLDPATLKNILETYGIIL